MTHSPQPVQRSSATLTMPVAGTFRYTFRISLDDGLNGDLPGLNVRLQEAN